MSFKASGLRSHQRQSLDIRCQNEGPQFDDSDNCDMNIDPQRFISDIIKNMTSLTGEEYPKIEVDSAGDLFGDYQDYIPDEFGMDLDSNVSDDESEGTDDEEEYILANNSQILEPERLPPSESFLSCPSADDVNLDETDLTTKGKASRLRGGAEEVLQKRPFIVKFTKGRAGATYTNKCVDGDNLNVSYTRNIGNAENSYSPFSSKLEWEIAHWAKMRGPSSTAFDELIKIEGVSFTTGSCEVTHSLS